MAAYEIFEDGGKSIETIRVVAGKIAPGG